VRRNKNFYLSKFSRDYFGMSFAFESGADGASAGAAGAVCAGVESITLPDTFGREVAIYESPRLVRKKTAARAAVARERKLAEPVAPNRLPDAPLPNAAPMSAPFAMLQQHESDDADARDDMHGQQQGV
jgi:hypothetical protein